MNQTLVTDRLGRRPLRCQGLTLLEVVAASVLLATAMFLLLRSESLHWKQLQRARLIDQALPEIDQFMSTMVADPSSVPLQSRGNLPDHRAWYWTIDPVDQPLADLPPSLRRCTVRFYHERFDDALLQCQLVIPRREEAESP